VEYILILSQALYINAEAALTSISLYTLKGSGSSTV